MAMCVVVVINDREKLQRLCQQLASSQPPLAQLVAVGEGETDVVAVERLNPDLRRQKRQKAMARWLMPFGFFAGVTFTAITDLHTFDRFGAWGQPLIGGLLGMGSGWMGSFAASASVVSEDDDKIRALRNRLDEGNWLLLLEPAAHAEVPWSMLQKARPSSVVRLGEV